MGEEKDITQETTDVDSLYPGHSTTINGSNENSKQVYISLDKAKSLLRIHQSSFLMSPSEELSQDIGSLKSNLSNNIIPTSTNSGKMHSIDITGDSSKLSSQSTDGDIDRTVDFDNSQLSEILKVDITATVSSLCTLVKSMSKEIQHLKFKNMILSSNENDYKSKYEVEENLQRRQFEKIKSQLMNENQEALTKLKVKENKVIKYKKRIMEKNMEINRLTRILNDNSLNNAKILNPKRSLSATASLAKRDSITSEKMPDMLNALGILATQVLNDRAPLGNASVGNEPPKLSNNNSIDANMTENDIAQGTDVDATINADPNTTNSSLIYGNSSTIKISMVPAKVPQKFQLPKMKSFSTNDGTVKDI
ncbi:hypothetical protein Kpol_1058p52 [Vanderwaltozyma polyspora DSM 70294]|uniref:Uncharacterized protein n=1 Tax=Vanderwaltozyma polyspora (strain ATCC 22028 / DSM 70294 / BCRC 21397 / CBS 2163 / NBRC 10782 / NRRL Y-8283 / UCD 57-17) TaxID=436907 RepID=A7TJT6_VANPO|nr:uncharacterized protein Kpol_1058p52 [Vanderwaltozyma polyspora DSM 70294]EDO17515.1 hypothetical protein Kpol_1058p52 [Vanderwaltozyma polyspora DSM 70294]